MKYLTIILSLICSLSVKAQHNHTEGDEDDNTVFKHSPQHGGEIIDAGKYKLEVLVNPMGLDEKLTVYVLKKNYKEVELKESTATVIFRYKDGQIDTVTLTKHINKYTTNDINPAKSVNMIFNMKINKHDVLGTYFYKGLLKN